MKLIRLISIFFCIVGVEKSYAQEYVRDPSSNIIQCPVGYYYGGESACLDDSLDIDTLEPLSSTGICSNEYTRVVGTSFCIAKKGRVHLSVDNSLYLLDGPYDSCDASSSRELNRYVCVDTFLALDLIGDRVVLVSPRLDCPYGYEQKSRATECTQVLNLPTLTTSTLTPDCSPGFIRPPGVVPCISFPLARRTQETRNYGFPAPIGECPQYWRKRVSGGYCFPENVVVSCGETSFPCGPIEKVIITDDLDCCPDSSFPFLGHIPNANGQLFISAKPTIQCGPPGNGVHLNCTGISNYLANY